MTLHPAWSYMLRDAGGSLWGTLVFALALLCPGYCVGRWLDVGGFRARGLREQTAWSVALSFGFTLPLLGVVWLGGMAAGEVLLVALGMVAVVLCWRDGVRVDVSRREAWGYGTAALVWILVVVASLIDVGVGDKLYMSVTSFDHGLRTAFTEAAMRTGVPPVSPVYWPGHDVPMRYYYFWYVTCGTVARIAHISARQAFVASCVWPLAGVGAMVALFGRYLLGWRSDLLRVRFRVGVLLLAVTGFDLPVVVFNRMAGGVFSGDMEWWSLDQVSSWADTFLWVPHHAAALVCSLLCLLLLWMADDDVPRGRRMTMAALAGVSYGGAFGLSTYVAVAVAGIVGSWLGWRMLAAERRRVLGVVGTASVVSAAMLSPYVLQLLHHGAGQEQSAGHVLGFGLREMLDPAMLLPMMTKLQAVHPWRVREIAASVLLVPGYVVELGFFGAAFGVVLWRRSVRNEGMRTLLVWVWSGLAVSSFVRSQVIATNDYGMRASLLMQFFLVLLGVVALEGTEGWLRKTLLGLAMVGVCGSVYQVVMLRTFLGWSEAHGDPDMADLAERNYALRDANAELRVKIPRDARLQYDNAAGGYFENALDLQTGYQVVNEDEDCNVSFGGDVSVCPGIKAAVAKLFPNNGVPAPRANDAVDLCQKIEAQYLVVTRWDDAWGTKDGWVWRLPAVVVRPGVRVVACGNRGSLSSY